MIPHSSPWLGDPEARAVLAVLRSGQLIGGPLLPEFQHEMHRVTGAASSFVFPSGRVGVLAALSALRLRPGAAVIVQTYVCDAVVWAIEKAGLVPVFCDIGPGWIATPETVAQSMSDQVGALVLAPPFGLFQSARPFRTFGLPIVHDLCQGNPGTLHDRWAEAGDLVVLSFHATKYVCAASGGAVLLQEGAAVERLGALQAEWMEAAPLDEVRSTLGVAQLRRLAELRNRRLQLAERYRAGFPAELLKPLLDTVDVPPEDLFRFVLRGQRLDFERLHRQFAAFGIAVRRGVDQLAHRARGLSDTAFPNALRAFAETLSVPFYPQLKDGDAEDVIAAARALLGS